MSAEKKRRNERKSRNDVLNLRFATGTGALEIADALSPSASPGIGAATATTFHHRRINAKEAQRSFMLQNFQFVINSALCYGDNALRITKCIQDSNEMPPWELVSFVVCRETFESHRCPICLDDPQAPRILRCGHLFCYPCILRQLDCLKATSAPRICPVCNSPALLSALRPVTWVPITIPKVSAPIAFTLIRRRKWSCQTLLPQHEPNSFPIGSPRSTDPAAAAILATEVPFYGTRAAFFCRYSFDHDAARASILMSDVADLHNRMKRAQEEGVPQEDQETEIHYCSEALAWVEGRHPHQTKANLNVAAAGRDIRNLTTSQPVTDSSTAACSQPSQQLSQDFIELYRAADGQQVYLHLINTRMLREEAATNDQPLPLCVEAPLLDLEVITQSQYSQSHCKPLSHVPLHSAFQLAYVDLSRSVSRKTFGHYAQQVNLRLQRLRNERRADEESAQMTSEEAWERYKGTLWDTPTPSPDLVASMPALMEVMPALELPQSEADRAATDGQQHDTSATAAVTALQGSWATGSGACLEKASSSPGQHVETQRVVARFPHPEEELAEQEEDDVSRRKQQRALEGLFTSTEVEVTAHHEGTPTKPKRRGKHSRGKTMSLTESSRRA